MPPVKIYSYFRPRQYRCTPFMYVASGWATAVRLLCDTMVWYVEAPSLRNVSFGHARINQFCSFFASYYYSSTAVRYTIPHTIPLVFFQMTNVYSCVDNTPCVNTRIIRTYIRRIIVWVTGNCSTVCWLDPPYRIVGAQRPSPRKHRYGPNTDVAADLYKFDNR